MSERLTTSGQPTEEQLGSIRDLGVTHVVNLGLHTHEKALPDEAASVAALGMRYVHLPVDFDNPTDDDFQRFCALIDELAETTLHVHCIANFRVSAFFYRYRRDVLRMSEDVARADMEKLWKPGGVWAEFIARKTG